MKNKLKRPIILVVLFVLIINCISGNSLAISEWWKNPSSTAGMTNTSTSNSTSGSTSSSSSGSTIMGMSEDEAWQPSEEETEVASGWDDYLGNVFSVGVGLRTTLLRWILLVLGAVGQVAINLVALSGGCADGALSFVTAEQILFNRLAMTDINFFSKTYADGVSLPNDSPVITIRENIAKWYYSLRTLAVIILLLVLLYIGIRMALSTVAEEKAVYKKMLVNWAVSMALVFVLHYIIAGTIFLNNSLVNIIYTARGTAYDESFQPWGSMMLGLFLKGLLPTVVMGWGSTILFVGIEILTVMFLIMYLKRMLTIAFLILIAPLITVTYSIDKIGDGQSQALNTWFKEFAYNILIQPFHCLIYLVFIGMSAQLTEGSLAGFIFILISMWFIFKAEGIVRNIFGFEKSKSLGTGIQSAAITVAGLKAIGNWAGKGAKAIGKVPNMKAAMSRSNFKENTGKTEHTDIPLTDENKETQNSHNYNDNSNNNANQNNNSNEDNRQNSSNTGNSDNKNNTGGNTNNHENSNKQEQIGASELKTEKDTQNAVNKVKSAGELVGKLLGKDLVTGANVGRIIGGIAGGFGEETIKGAMGGMYIGSQIGAATESKMSSKLQERQVRSNEETLAYYYQKLAKSKENDPNYNIMIRTKQFLEMSEDNIDDMKDRYEQEYARNLKAMALTYKVVGHENANEVVLDTVRNQISTGKIKPRVEV